jgi:hypothetical protein
VTAALLAAALAGLAVALPGGGGSRSRLRRLGEQRARQRCPLPGTTVLDLVAAVLAAGAPVATSLRLVGDALGGYGVAGDEELQALALRSELAIQGGPAGGPAWVQLLDRTLLLARDGGLAPAGLLASAAADERRRRVARQRIAAARLGVRVVLPGALCLLPAFVLLTVAPLLLALLGAF